MSIKSSLKNLVTVLGGTSTAKTTAGILGEIAVALGGSGNGKSIESQLNNIVDAKNPIGGFTVDVTVAADEDLLGKVISDFQEDITVGASSVTGTLKYVSGYTGFSGVEEEQSGNYLVLHASVPEVSGVTIKVKTAKMEVTLDADGILIYRVTDKTKPIVFTASKSGAVDVVKKFDLSGLDLEEDSSAAS